MIILSYLYPLLPHSQVMHTCATYLCLYLLFLQAHATVSTSQSIYVQGGIINLQFRIDNGDLNVFLQDFINRVGVVQVRMGSKNEGLDSKYPSNGVTTLIHNTTQLQPRSLSFIGSILSISVNPPFIIWFPHSNTTIISNPNDKLCSQQVDSIIRTFLPCKNHAGLATMLDSSLLLTGRYGYTGIQMLWTHEAINIRFMVQRGGEGVPSLVRKRVKHRCSYFGEINITREDRREVRLPAIVVDEFNKDSSDLQGQTSLNATVTSRRFIKGNWYGGPRHLHHIISNLNNTHRQIIIPTLFPEGLTISKLSLSPTLSPSIMTTIEQCLHHKHTLIRIMITSASASSPLPGELHLTISFSTSLLNFDRYENIAGGGEEFMRIPISLKGDSIKGYADLDSGNVSDSLIQPDFSIPFHVITFTIAILAYLSVNLWKTYYQYLPSQNNPNLNLNEPLNTHQNNKKDKLHKQ